MIKQEHIIKAVTKKSIAKEYGIEPGDILVSINNMVPEDIFDYQYQMQNEQVTLVIRSKRDNKETAVTIEKEQDEDLGLRFESGLMDEYHSCSNHCIFCFIDQMPKGMRETLYFKDDDTRLSFLQGNYVTLTNLSDHDIDRMIAYHLSPINISFQTTNPELRCRMLNNRFAGEALKKAERLYEAGITMNGQIVLCKGVNDGDELERTVSDLYRYVPVLQSLSIVPVGLSKYRDGLYPLEPINKQDAERIICLVEKWQDIAFTEHGIHYVHASDEIYLTAEHEIPKEECYDSYLQLSNGVGMLTLLQNEVMEAFRSIENKSRLYQMTHVMKKGAVSLATGQLAFPVIKKITEEMMRRFPGTDITVYPIRNDFFGERITVSGLLTGQDIINQLKGQRLGRRLLLPENVLRRGEDVFLDDVKLDELEKALQVKVDIVKSSGQDLVNTILYGKQENRHRTVNPYEISD